MCRICDSDPDPDRCVLLEEGHRAELTAYKGVMISKANPEKDMFKINLLNMMQNK